MDQNEQALLRSARVAVLGVGGMGGAVAQILARSGIGTLHVLDKDTFEPSNNNRQVYARSTTWGRSKVQVTAHELRAINPALQVRAFDRFDTSTEDAVFDGIDIVVNGMDELPACLRLWRAAAVRRIPLVDAWSAPLPNVFVVRPGEPSPEALLRYPTLGQPEIALTDSMVDACKLREALHVALHSRSLRHLDPQVIREIMNGTRARISFAPMVWGAANLMAWEVIKLRLARGRIAPPAGVFWDPWDQKYTQARAFYPAELALISAALKLQRSLR